MTLLELLAHELPKRGGWPEGATCARQDRDKEVCFIGTGCVDDFTASELASDVNEYFLDRPRASTSDVYITKKQYKDILAKNRK
ncbi:hypothetical protein [Pantoea ananatis]|uniref:hypothetical protein n=1 Tax=Pantoea ananas TaxID=553 RepID=UPI0005C660F9|nr:hypothetical protein [Pantoea ananatis]